MRLIDADKLKTTAVLGMQLQYVDCTYYYFYEEDIIANAPTVEAIPVDWIEKKCRELYEHLYLDESLGVQMLLRDWEKENGKD